MGLKSQTTNILWYQLPSTPLRYGEGYNFIDMEKLVQEAQRLFGIHLTGRQVVALVALVITERN